MATVDPIDIVWMIFISHHQLCVSACEHRGISVYSNHAICTGLHTVYPCTCTCTCTYMYEYIMYICIYQKTYAATSHRHIHSNSGTSQTQYKGKLPFALLEYGHTYMCSGSFNFVVAFSASLATTITVISLLPVCLSVRLSRFTINTSFV